MKIGQIAPLARGARLLLGSGMVVWLLGCGGGEQEPGNYGPPRDITISKIALSDATPVAIGGLPVYFVGGECGGGNGPLRVKWTYGGNDGGVGTYTFPVPVLPTVSKWYTVRAKCTDGSGAEFKWALDTLDVYVYAPGHAP